MCKSEQPNSLRVESNTFSIVINSNTSTEPKKSQIIVTMAGGSEVMAVLMPFISWSILPQLLTKFALKGLYDMRIITRPSTPIQAQLHARRVQAIVIIGYLLYTVYATVFKRDANYYEVLGIPLDCDADDIRRSFRRLARIYHPDKTAGRQQDQLFFIEIRKAHDALADPLKRLAYDRFGPSVLEKRELLTEREFFLHGFQNSLGFYIVHPISYGFVNWLAGKKAITYWLITLYIILLASEFSLIMGVRRWNGFGLLPATMTAHDLVASLHSAYTAVILASSHLGPLLPTLRNPTANTSFNHLFDGAASEKDMMGLRELVMQQETRLADIHIQSGRNQDMNLLPLRPLPKSSVSTLQQAANEAAKRRSKPRNLGTGPSVRQPSRLEQTFIHRLSQLILRHRLEVIPAVREAEKKRSASRHERKEVHRTESEASVEEVPSSSNGLNGNSSNLNGAKGVEV